MLFDGSSVAPIRKRPVVDFAPNARSHAVVRSTGSRSLPAVSANEPASSRASGSSRIA